MAAREERAGATRPLHAAGRCCSSGSPLPAYSAGYFGAAQGVILLGMIGASVPEGIQRVNALKNVLAGLVNAVAAAVFIVVAEVDWLAAGLVAAGAALGGLLGAHVGGGG